MRDAATPLDLDRDDWAGIVKRLGERVYRVRQILAWIHERGVLDPDGWTDLSRPLRERLKEGLPGGCVPEVVEDATARDGTIRLTLGLRDGGTTETVLIPEDEEEPGGDDGGEAAVAGVRPAGYTQCLSTQVGCAFGCVFCRSGSGGFERHLSAGEILAQRHRARVRLGAAGSVTRSVFMGIGEPLHNLDGLLPALRILTDPEAGRVSGRRITVSTIGLPDGVRALGEATGGRVNLAWSLHAADEAVRARLVPGVGGRIGEMVEALRAWPLPPRRRITVECVLVAGVNDGEGDARAIVARLRGLRCKVNLIPFNRWTEGVPGGRRPPEAWEAPTADRLEAFRGVLAGAGVATFVRRPRGGDVLAACGQLLGRGRLCGAPGSDS
jgi:23S rRNA (adenine2503-C2)-methyltransferase